MPRGTTKTSNRCYKTISKSKNDKIKINPQSTKTPDQTMDNTGALHLLVKNPSQS